VLVLLSDASSWTIGNWRRTVCWSTQRNRFCHLASGIAIVGPVYGFVRLIQFFRDVGFAGKAFAIISLLYASAVALIGSIFLVIGVLSLRAFKH